MPPAPLSVVPQTAAAPPANPVMGGGENSLAALERILAEQNRAMAQLMNQQLEVVRQTLGGQSPDIIYLNERRALDYPGKRVAWAGKKAVTHQFVKLLRRRVMAAVGQKRSPS